MYHGKFKIIIHVLRSKRFQEGGGCHFIEFDLFQGGSTIQRFVFQVVISMYTRICYR